MATRTLTKTNAQEFETICDQIGSCELVRGEVVPLSPGDLRHSDITANVAYLVSCWARQSKQGKVFAGEAGLIVETDPDTVRGADVAYISYQRLPRGKVPAGFSTIPPELVVEVVGKGQGWREMVEKAGEYLHMGVDRVWVIDPQSRRLHVFRSDHEPTALSEDQAVVDEAVLPGFTCRVSEFFAD